MNKSEYTKNIKKGMFIVFLLMMVNIANAGTFTFVETYTPANLYVPIDDSDGVTAGELTKISIVSDSDNRIYYIGPGESLKIKVIIPPGVDNFNLPMSVSKWQGDFYYGKSLTDSATTEGYDLATSTGYSFVYVDITAASSDVPNRTTSNTTTTSQMTAYAIIENRGSDTLTIGTLGISFTVNESKVTVYNDWVTSTGSGLPIQANTNGGSISYVSAPTTTSSSSSVVVTNEGGNSNVQSCSPFLGNCSTTTSTTTTPTTSTSSTSTTTSSSSCVPSTTGICSSPSVQSSPQCTCVGLPTYTPTTSSSTSTSSSITESNGVTTGTYSKELRSSSDPFYLWESTAVDDGTPLEPYTTRHYRLRIEESDYDNIASIISPDALANLNVAVDDTVYKRSLVQITGADNQLVTVYPYSESPDLLMTELKSFFPSGEVGITPKGMLYAIDGTNFYYAYLSYFISKPQTAVTSGKYEFQEVLTSADGKLTTMQITYPSGNKQKIFLYSTTLETVN